MPIAVSCPECGKGYNLADTQRGKTVACRACEAKFVVEDERPTRRSHRDEEEDERPVRRSRKAEEEDDRPRRFRRDDEDERDPDRRPRRHERDEEEGPQPRSKRRPAKRGGGMLWLLVGGGVGLALIGGLVVVLAVTGVFGPNRVTVENYQKLKPGMSQKEIEAILGTPRDSTKQALAEVDEFAGMKELSDAMRREGYKVLVWESGKNKIRVTLLRDRAVSFDGQFEVKGGTMRMKN